LRVVLKGINSPLTSSLSFYGSPVGFHSIGGSPSRKHRCGFCELGMMHYRHRWVLAPQIQECTAGIHTRGKDGCCSADLHCASH
jgi:hypothetical protein